MLPVFPLGSTVHLPGSLPGTNIWEPRYCEMYSDIILNGSRRFVVPLVMSQEKAILSSRVEPNLKIRIAEVGALWYVEDYKKMDNEVGGRVKFMCKHKVIGLVRIKKLLNPGRLVDRGTYLRASVEVLSDLDEDEDCTEQAWPLPYPVVLFQV